MIALAAFLLLAAAAPDAAETPFEEDPQSFADAATCKAHLAGLAASARSAHADAVEGPYDIAPGDVRIHSVRAEAGGHRIAEHRCLGARLSARSWRHAMAEREPAFTVESVARTAEWLKKPPAEQ